MTPSIERMLQAELRDTKLQLQKYERIVLDQRKTIEALNRQIAALGKVIRGVGKNLDARNGMAEW